MDRHIVLLILAECCLQLINAAFMMILLIYMQKEGYADYEAAYFTKFRFLSVLLFSIPIGYYIRGRKIKPLFYFACIVVPLSSLVLLYAVHVHYDTLIMLSQFIWGMGFVGLQIAAVPFILRNSSPGTMTEGISLSHATWSIAGVVSGIMIYGLHRMDPIAFNERNLLVMLALAGFAGLVFIRLIDIRENLNDPEDNSIDEKGHDWDKIGIASIPIIIIATGAGLTIPFISLFFYNIHGIDSHSFSLIASLALSLVFFSALMVPQIKNKLGFRIAVPLTQSLAIISLVALAYTENYKGTSAGLFAALGFYALRQPLMNMATPMTTEVTMKYVGKRNQEMMSALTASIWSGSWFISAYLFEIMREMEVSYMNIFLITAALYSVGVIAYMLLMRKIE
ncbi:MAG TPA: hypothetical protein PK798_02750 [Flavobacteriales bacterium]|nr:hypothetical protein [Flavobacteriales bacterium]HRJ35071.1 hypothetical protein [Flavobacteriales bacterium]HRJ37678.1 hypothetical protein [Flavobacteriales bacterium]